METRTIEVDICIVGAGPAGLTAGLYAGRSGKSTLVLDGRAASRLSLGYEIENYPGFPSINSQALREKFLEHARGAGARVVPGEAVAMALDGDIKFVTTKDALIQARTVILATGKPFRRDRLIPGEERLTGLGVSYCATCDGPLFRGRDVAAFGRSEEAAEETLALAQMGCRVHWIPGGPDDDALEALAAKPRDRGISVYPGVALKEIAGGNRVERVILEDASGVRELPVAAVFVFREVPSAALFSRTGLEMDHRQCLAVDRYQRTNLAGVFAAGDVTCGGQQVVTACGEGCVAALQALIFLRK